MEQLQPDYDIKAILKFAGAFIAWLIGSGFATGQEILQFFSSYGYASYGIVLICLFGFLAMAQTLLITGYDQKDNDSFSPYSYFCGRRLGTFYSWIIPAILFLLMSVLISGAGATLNEYYGVDSRLGAALMAIMVLCAFLMGFERLIRMVSAIGPVIILFSLFVGAATLLRDFHNIGEISRFKEVLADKQSTPNWFISSILYVSLNFLCGGTYFSALGASAKHRNSAKWGATLGAGAVILSIAIMNTAILLNGGNAALLSVPTLYLAKKLSFILGAVFSIVLILGMFSCCSAIMWTVCNRFSQDGTRRSRIVAAVVACGSFLLGMLPFAKLMAIFYPFVGYMGLPFVACVLYRSFKNRRAFLLNLKSEKSDL
ncbi:membrane protein [Bacillota bacterium]